MITAIMQPYFFPYIGYFQLMAAADLFIVYDDAQFMKGGWINRNRILLGGGAHWWTYPLLHDHYALPINRREYIATPEAETRLFAQLENAYRKAPHYAEVAAWLSAIWPKVGNVAAFNTATLGAVAEKLGLSCQIVSASSIPVSEGSGEERILRICEAVGATTYVNAAGGVGLYDRGRFRARGVDLQFLAPNISEYAQFGAPPVVALSIVDTLMFRGFEATAASVARFSLQGRD